MQVEACIHLADSQWAAACSSLTGTSWHGGLSIFKAGSPHTTTYQWLCEEGGVTSVDAWKETLVTGCMSGQVHIHSLQPDFKGECVNTIDAHQGPVSATAFNPTGALIVSASHDCKINLYSLSAESGEETLIKSTLAHHKPILCVSWVNDSSFVSGGRDGAIKLWDTRTNTDGASEFSGKPTSQITSKQQSYAISVRGDEIAVGEEDGISFYDFRKGSETLARITGFKAPVKAVSFSGNLLAFGTDDGQTQVVDVSQENKVVFSAKHSDFVRTVAWNKEKREYISGGWGVLEDGTLDVQLHSDF